MAPPSRSSMAAVRGPSASIAATVPIAHLQQQQMLPPTGATTFAHTDYSLELLTEYAHTLDAMPLELSRVFAELRELDAVLTSTVASVTAKIYRLAEMIESSRRTKKTSTSTASTEDTISPATSSSTLCNFQPDAQTRPLRHAPNPSFSNEQRLWLLGEIAEEAGKIRPGTDDKIRIATQAADALQQQRQYLTQLALHLPEYEPAMLVPKTRYPHVSPRAYLPAGHHHGHGHRDHGSYYGESSQRRRRAQNNTGLMGNVADSAGATGGTGASASNSPAKKRRIAQDEDQDYAAMSNRSPRKDKTVGEHTAQSRTSRGPRSKKAERQASPPESIQSVASHLQTNTNARSGSGGARNSASGGGIGTTSSSKRRANNPNHANAYRGGGQDSSLLESVISRKDGHHNLAPSSSTSHPSLMDASDHAHANERFGHDADRKHGHGHGHNSSGAGADATSGSHAHRQALEGSGVSAAGGRSVGSGGLAMNKEGSPALAPLSTSPSGTGTGSSAGTVAGGVSGVGAGGGVSVDGTADVDMDADGDDGKVYCFCETVSYGEMIACDQDGCEREWFHLACIGLTEAPKGAWYCDDCVSKRNKQRNSRGGKKRAGGGGGGGGGGRSSHRNNGS